MIVLLLAPSVSVSTLVDLVLITQATLNILIDSLKEFDRNDIGDDTGKCRQLHFLELASRVRRPWRLFHCLPVPLEIQNTCVFNFLILADAYVWNNFSVLILLSLLKIVASVSLVGLLAEYLCVCCLVGIYQIKINRAIAGHVIAPDQLLPVALARGSSGLQLDFTYHSRATPAMVRRRRLCRVVSVICVAELPCSSLCSYV